MFKEIFYLSNNSIFRKFLLTGAMVFTTSASAGLHQTPYGTEELHVRGFRVKEALDEGNSTISLRNGKKFYVEISNNTSSEDSQYLEPILYNKITAYKTQEGHYTGRHMYTDPVTGDFKRIAFKFIPIENNMDQDQLHNNNNILQKPSQAYRKLPEQASSTFVDEATGDTNVYIHEGIKYIPNKDFHKYYDENKKFFICMERVTRKNVQWWKERVAFDAYILLKQCEMDYGNCPYASFPYNLQDITRRVPRGINSCETEALLSQFDQFFPKVSVCEFFEPKNLKGYLGALKAFQYNLDNLKNGELPTWIAFVSSKDFDQPLYLSEEPVSSPEIKMAMTVRIDRSFYSAVFIAR